MKYPIQITAAPGTEPISVQEAKDFFREDRNIEDQLISQFVSAARKALEKHTGHVLIDTEFKMHLQDFDDVKIPKRPVKDGSVSIEYVDTNGTIQTLDSSKYNVHKVDRPVEIEFLSDLPELDEREDTKYPVIISFTAGYGTTEDDIPNDWKGVVGLVAMILWQRDIPMQDESNNDFNPLNLGVVRMQLENYMIGRFK